MEPSVGDDLSRKRRDEVIATINGIVDPCSQALRVPIGIADLGLVEALDVSGENVTIVLMTTTPFCMFVGMFQEEARRRVSTLPWVDSVQVQMKYDAIWDESRLAESVRIFREHRRRPGVVQPLQPRPG